MARSRKKKENCIVAGCDNDASCKEMCNKHYRRFKRHGDVNINYTAAAQYKKRNQLSCRLSRESSHNRTYDEHSTLREMFGEGYSINGGEHSFNVN